MNARTDYPLCLLNRSAVCVSPSVVGTDAKMAYVPREEHQGKAAKSTRWRFTPQSPPLTLWMSPSQALVSVLVVGASLGAFLLLLGALSLSAIASAAVLCSLAALGFLSCFLTASFLVFCVAVTAAGMAIATAATFVVSIVTCAGGE